MKKIGVDLGGTKIEAVLLNDNTILKRKRIKTPSHNYDSILGAISDIVSEMSSEDIPIGVCVPCVVSETGLVLSSNTESLTGRMLHDDLQRTLDKDIVMENDANCFALAEAVLGAAKEYRTVFGAILGTGVGGGLIIDGKIHHGKNGIAGEWGHHILHTDGNPCYCGRKGCTETYLSGPALERRWHEITGKKAPLSDIAQECTSGRWKDEFLSNLEQGLSNVITIVDPDVIVLGGGVSNIEFLYSRDADMTQKSVFFDSIRTPILQNSLGDSAGVIGACLL